MPQTAGNGGRDALPDDTGCHILHVDMDAFYASVEIRDRPELAGRPVIVGGASGRGVVLSATYPARAFGVRSAMPVTRARRLCPHAVFLPPRHGLYSSVSKEVMAVFRSITPDVEPLALDEAFLDVSGALRRLGTPAGIGELIRRQVSQQQGITCSVGVASSKFVAKLASVHCKPDGLLVIPAHGVIDFLHPLPVAALWGVGERTGQALARLGLRTVADIAHTPADTLERDLGQAAAAHLHALAWGRDPRKVTPGVHEKSIGAEETFPVDIDDPEVIRRELLRLSGRTARGLRSADCAARTIVVKLRLRPVRRGRARRPRQAPPGRGAGERPGSGGRCRHPAGLRGAAGILAGSRPRRGSHRRPIRHGRHPAGCPGRGRSGRGMMWCRSGLVLRYRGGGSDLASARRERVRVPAAVYPFT